VQKIKISIGIGLLFIFGVLVGILGTGMYIKAKHPLLKDSPNERNAFILKRLNRELKLSDIQKQRVSEIVDRMQEHILNRFKQHQSEIAGVIENGFNQIKQELNPDQQEKFKRLKHKLDHRRRQLEHHLFKDKALQEDRRPEQ
jgi:hypothetical protein